MKRLRNDLLQSAIIGTEQRRDKALRELIRLQDKLDELRRKAARLAKRAVKERVENTARLQQLEQPLDPVTQASLVTAPQRTDDGDVDLSIPDWLWRGPRAADVDKAADADKVAADQIRAEQAKRKRAKAVVRIEKMKAKQRGDTRKMPLSGKAALKFIKEGV